MNTKPKTGGEYRYPRVIINSPCHLLDLPDFEQERGNHQFVAVGFRDPTENLKSINHNQSIIIIFSPPIQSYLLVEKNLEFSLFLKLRWLQLYLYIFRIPNNSSYHC